MQRSYFLKIKNSNLLAEKENIFPSNYIKEKYPLLNEVVPKNSILFKVKYKPDIIINQYNQTSNNINSNINIKPNPSLRNSRNIKNQPTYISQNKYYNEFTNNTLLNYLDENDFNNPFYNNISDCSDNNIFGKITDDESPIRNMKFIQWKNDNSQKIKENNFDINTNKNNNSSERELINKIKNISINSKNYSPVSQNSEHNLKNYKIGNNNNLYINIKDNNPENFSKFDYDNDYNKINPSKKEIIEDLRAKNNYIKNKDFFPRKRINKTVKNEINKKIKDYNNSDNNNININTNNILNEKLEIYRTKLFNEFFKHFKLFYNIRLKKYYFDFIKRIKKLINTYKIIFKNNNDRHGNNHYKLNKDFYIKYIDKSHDLEYIPNNNNKPIYKKINKIIINNKRNDNITKIKNEQNALPKNKNNVKSAEKIKINRKNNTYNYNYLSIKRNDKKDLLHTNSLSPSFKFGNEKIIIRDMNFKTEGNVNENELYRDTNELNKKYKQIQSRRVWSKLKNRNRNKNKKLSININSEKNNNKSNIDSEFEKIRNYMKLIKKKEKSSQGSSKTNTFNSLTTKNINNKKPVGIKKLEYENKNNFNEFKNKSLYTNIMQRHNNKVLKINNQNSYTYNQAEIISNSNSFKNNNTNQNKSFNNIKKKDIELLQLNNKNKQNNNNDISNNNSLNIFKPPKNNIYFSFNNTKKNKKKHKVFSARIKNISTKDKRINICINYYFLIRKNKSKYERYNFLFPSNNFSLNYIKNNLKSKLSSIKEEDCQISNFNDKNENSNANINEKIRQYYKIVNTREEISRKSQKKDTKYIK